MERAEDDLEAVWQVTVAFAKPPWTRMVGTVSPMKQKYSGLQVKCQSANLKERDRKR
jgi:hypothetical protein